MAQKMNKIYYVCFLTCLHLIYKSAATNDNEITKAFKLLKEGDENIIFSEEHKNVTLVIGNTGAGKTTFLQWIAGDKDELMSQEQGENMGQFIIVDQKDRISISTINSKTIFPELVVDNNTNEAYYDCPGFRDSRSLSHDIAGTYFTKKLTDYYEGFKIVLIANYHSVRKGIDRHDFINLMRHTTEFIKNVTRFKNSIAMVVTKVENTYIETEEQNHDLVPDEEVIKNIANFLQNVKDHLKEKVEKLDIEEKFYESTIKLLNILLENDNGTYTRLGIFRRPNKKGLLSEVTVLQEGKKHVQQILRERLKYSLKGENDFGFTISEKSKNDINGLVEEILNKLRIDIADIILDIQKYCSNEITRVNSGLDSFIDDAEVVTTDLHTNLAKIHHITSIIPLLLKQVENLSDAQHLSGIISKAIIDLRIHADIDKITNIAVQGRYYNFFKNICRSKMKTEQWITYFSPIVPILRDAKEIEKHIRNKVDTIDKKIKHQGIKHLTDKELDEYYRKELDKLDIKDVPAAASNFKTSALDLLSYRKCMELLKILNDGELKTWPAKWMAHFQKTIKYLSESVKWYQFLGDLLDELSTYQVQMNRNKYNVANIDNWGKESNQTGIWINKYNFKRFIEKLGSKYDLVKDLEVTESQLRELNHLLDLTLKDTIKIECGQSGELVIKGNYVKISDITLNKGTLNYGCETSSTSVKIFALDMLIIDQDIKEVGSELKLSILAPKWHVVGTRKINLDGSQAQPHYPSKANDGNYPGGKGTDGKPGLPGGPAGNFFGKANQIENGQFLTVTANGGSGGSGQDGGNGANGRSGRNARVDDSFPKTFIRDDKIITVFYNKIVTQYKYFGDNGSPGGSGGNGGVKGCGGLEGRVELSIFRPLRSPNIKNNRGLDGPDGKGGAGGIGGEKGHDIIGYYCDEWALFVPVKRNYCGEEIRHSWGRASSGRNGKDGVNGLKQQPKKPKPFQEISEVLNDYKKYLQDNMDKLVIKGSYVKTSDFTDNDGKIRNKCNVNLNSVNIFASDTLIIDKDLNGVGKQLQLSILSPKWHVVGTKKIDLDGSQPPHPSRASDSSIPSGTGSDGQAGLPGGPAGNFFGLANEITNGESLTITANGGPGGFGQDGGNGGTGRKGEDAKRDDSFERKYITGDKLITLFYNKNTYQYRYRGKPGAVGGPGGNGGVGGYGGWEGRIKMLILLKSLNLPTTRNSGGSDGTGGKGGNGGRGGTRGNDIIAHYCETFALFIPIQLEWCGEDIIMSTDTANLGANGKKDFTGVKMPPEKPKSFQNIPEILNDYKYYLRENLLDRFKKRPLLQFLQKMDNKEKVKGEYDTIGLVEEFHQLEKQRDTLSGLQRENFIYFYQSILNRTHELAKNLPLPNKRVLSLLYTAVFGILNNLEAGSNPNLIINVEQNFDLLTENVKNLRTLQKKINKVEVIDRYKDMYKSVVNKKIEEAQSIITNRIIPKIEDTGIIMENQIESLTKEIIFLQEQNRELKGEMMQKKEQLEKLVTLHYVFSSLKIFGHIAKCFGLYGVIVGTATETVSLIGDPFIVNRVHLRSPPKLPDGVTSGIQKLQTAFRLDMTQSSIEKSNLIDKYKNNEKALKTIDEAIERAKYNIQNLERYEAEIREIAIPIVKNMERDIDRIVHQLSKKSKIALEEIKWQVQTVLKDMKLQMRLFTKGFKIEETLALCIENLEETVTTLINVYDMMQNYQQEKELADYLADISSPTSDKDFTDPKLWKAAKELEITIRSNLVLKQYQIAIGALKQQAFPLAYLYLEEPKLPNSLTLEDNFQSLIDKVIAQIATIKTKIKEYESSISHHDKYMNSGWFNGNFKSAQPFFIWEKEKYGDVISNLLSGKKVTLKPDILTSHPDKDAIKFNKIGIHFRSSNSNVTSEINDKLRMYILNATHSGNSYYRFNKNIYLMTSSSQNILYSFEKDDCGIPVIRNGVYEKIKTKYLMLSPYAMWEMQLVSVGKKNRSISDLEMYKDKVDLELVGHGAYLSIGYNISMADVEKYYKADDDLSAADFGN